MRVFSLRRVLPLLATLVLLVAACGGDDDATGDPPTSTQLIDGAGFDGTAPGGTAAGGAGATAAPSGSDAGGTCTGTISGSATGTIKSGGGINNIGSDYWLSDAEITQALELLNPGGTQPEGEFAAYGLILNCSGPDGVVVNFGAGSTKRADFPFAPKSYSIRKFAAVPAADVTALVTLGSDSYKAAGGTFDITRFDDTGIAGTFTLDALKIGDDSPIKVTGEFDMKCPSGGNCRA